MTFRNMARGRLLAQQLESPRFKQARDVVAFMGAMQAQDYAMAKWAVGIRLPGATIKDVDNALKRGNVIRTHLLRPTWHFVSPDDVRWMLALTAPHIKSS
ncbi:MAG: winged helix DNA-binding domain-containing protein, partial [Bacteroidetes bacterium]|nr:winged helix DNA-binding domain-containing protein [Bacteroidota bacterium]